MKLTRKTATAALATTVLVTGLGFAGVASATPGSGTTVTSDLWNGLLAGSERKALKVKQDGVELRTNTATTVTTFDLAYPPGAFSGWHSHPGIVIAVVQSGTVVRQTGCTSETFTAGQSFTEVGPHYVSNPGTETAVLSITRIYPSDQLTGRDDEPAPVCDGKD